MIIGRAIYCEHWEIDAFSIDGSQCISADVQLSMRSLKDRWCLLVTVDLYQLSGIIEYGLTIYK